MTNREAILRLSANTGDEPAMAWLRDKNSKIIRGVIARYFGAGPEADSAEGLLMRRRSLAPRRTAHFQPAVANGLSGVPTRNATACATKRYTTGRIAIRHA